jgi:hypothetical protein
VPPMPAAVRARGQQAVGPPETWIPRANDGGCRGARGARRAMERAPSFGML